MKNFNKHTFVSSSKQEVAQPSNTKSLLSIAGFWGMVAVLVIAAVNAFNYVQNTHGEAWAWAVTAMVLLACLKPFMVIAKGLCNYAEVPKLK